MEKNYENILLETFDGATLEGNAWLYDKNRLSELFNDTSIYFIVMEDTTDVSGMKKDRVFVNKDLIIWAAPREVKHTAHTIYTDNTEYVEISVRTVEGRTIEGKVNMQVFRNLDDMLRYTSLAPFVILINAHDGKGDFHHTLFINKGSIIQIETVLP